MWYVSKKYRDYSFNACIEILLYMYKYGLLYSTQNLTAPEPPSIRPQWLYITSKITTRPLVARTVSSFTEQNPFYFRHYLFDKAG